MPRQDKEAHVFIDLRYLLMDIFNSCSPVTLSLLEFFSFENACEFMVARCSAHDIIQECFALFTSTPIPGRKRGLLLNILFVAAG